MRVTKKPDVRKKELIELAKKLFLEKGYEKVSVREIIDKTDSAGSPGLFYYYFKSKKEIYESVIDEMVNEEITERQLILTKGERDDEDAISTITKLLELIQKDALEYQKFDLKGKNKQLLDNVSQRLIRSEESMIKRLVDRMLTEHTIPTNEILNLESSQFITTFIIYGSNGILTNLNSEDDRVTALNYIKLFINSLLNLKLD
ncbi:TetR/AcrR family transcriptional regulator [Lactiplantibacillus pentosus]|jgi:AcrR family transcriptional regulator|uniref:TetR/AcrR family transcriptional regulator n=1 Tax=Lactiplantibacillus pentosus TaxID=1589 RepID=UPI00207A0752|nr:TetR/AcrR family transcriptional regulator [Lactiplantibacillus pentosus]USJ86044.1 TetR/AcrR family transcriptional regulator [Lactiplantibacillus pentosus]